MTNHIFHPSILRAYDIRGIVDETLSPADAWSVGVSFATCLDKNKDKLKQTEINFQVSLANCGDHHDDII